LVDKDLRQKDFSRFSAFFAQRKRGFLSFLLFWPNTEGSSPSSKTPHWHDACPSYSFLGSFDNIDENMMRNLDVPFLFMGFIAI
jgi:hypothetical protein